MIVQEIEYDDKYNLIFRIDFIGVLIKETGEIRTFEFYNYPGSKKMKELRAFRRAINFLLKMEKEK